MPETNDNLLISQSLSKYAGGFLYNNISHRIDREATMNRAHLLAWGVGTLSLLGFACLGSSQEILPPPKGETLPPNPIEVQTRGPLHEAVAQPFDPKPGTPIPKQRPASIKEQLPDKMPDAENSQWLSGCWSGDPERQEFLWVSGVYRTPPQGRTFVPGYWAHSADGWRW